MAVDADTKKYLEEVKKGKSRRFVMICKGVKILSMIVYKKGTVEKYKKQAKQEGKGQFFHGVVSGKGQAISFNLLRSDGYEKPPGKELILKDFLKSEADMQFKPTYQIVDSLPDVDEGDDDGPTTGARDTATAAVKEEVPTPPTPDAPPADAAARAQKLAEALKKLKPLVGKVMNADPNRKGELQATMVQIAGEIKGKQFDQAKQNIVDFAALLKSLAAQPPAPLPSESADRSLEFSARRDALEPRLLEAQNADREKATKLGAVWDYANEQAAATNFDNAFKALDRLETAIDGLVGAPAQADAQQAEDASQDPNFTPQEDVDLSSIEEVPAGDLLAVWRNAKDSVDEQLNTLASKLADTGHVYLQRIAESGLPGLADNPGSVRVQAGLMNYNSSYGAAKKKAAEKLLAAIANYMDSVDASAAIEVCDTHRRCGPLKLRATLKTALLTIDKTVRAEIAN